MDGGQVFEMEVIESRRITPSIHKILLKKPDSFRFLPVQFTFLSMMTQEGMDSRPMSIATSPTRPNLEYAVRVSDSSYKSAFASLKPGDSVTVQGPYGDFILDEKRPAVLVAGGIGITPLKGMAEYAADRKLQIPVRLLYSNRTTDEIAYKSELEELEQHNPEFTLFHTLTGENVPEDWEGLRGRINTEYLRKASEGLERPNYYLCGTPGMVKACFDLLHGMKVSERYVNYEVFRGYWN
ncbi:FAD-dependent oxidoreductase [Candidatus Bathyarchaeota archaeon]|nr:FAD-dependent oxidoreductase [Candidatus Bathyarchaeota archaeon]